MPMNRILILLALVILWLALFWSPAGRLVNLTEIPPSDRLRWSPPVLSNPITIIRTTSGTINLDPTRDYIIELPVKLTSGIAIVGGRNIVIIGGHIEIPLQAGNPPSISSRRGLLIRDVTGTVFIEGLLLGGADLSEAIQIDSQQATVILQNIRAEDVHARNQMSFSDNHPDCLQPYGGYTTLRVYRFSCRTDYQGFYLHPDLGTFPGETTLEYVNIRSYTSTRYMFWSSISALSGDIELNNFWIDVPPERVGGLGKAVWTDVNNTVSPAILSVDAGGNPIAYWENHDPAIQGHITQGIPPAGDFVPQGVAGLGYISPGYWADATPTPTETPTAMPTETATEIPTLTLTPTEEITSAPAMDTPAPQWAFTVYFNDASTASFWCELTADLLTRFNVAHSIACPV